MYNSTNTSNKQRQEHNSLALICGAKTQENPWALQEPHGYNPKSQMQTLTRLDKVVIEDYYHMTIINENVYYMKLAHLLSNFSQNLRVPFYTSTFTSKFLIAFLSVHTKEKEHHSLMFTMYANISNNTPSYTHISLYVVWRVHPPGIIW